MCGFCFAAEVADLCSVKGPGSLQSNIDTIGFSIPDNTSSTETITIGGTRDETLESTGDKDWFRIELTEGDAIQIDLFGLDHDSGNALGELLDPYVRIRDDSGNALAENDDIVLGVQRDSQLVFQASETGTYYIEVDSYLSSYTGDYRLQVTATTPPPPASPVDAMQTNRILNSDDPILVYFAEAGDTYTYSGDTYTATGVNAYEQGQLFSVFEGVEQFIDVDFQITTDRNAADLEWATDTLPNSSGGTLLGFFFFPSSNGNGGFGVLNNNSSSFPSWNSTPGGTLDTGGFMYGVAVHELGHGLGLGHPHDGGGGSDVMQGVTSSGSRGNFGLNQAPFTAMSYNEGWVDNPAGLANSVASTGHGATFAALDIAALQNMYGANTTHAGGDDVYVLYDSNATGSGAGYYTTWDTGGTDEFRYSGTRDATIDLRDATLAYELGGGGFMSHVDNVIAGRTIANGVVIENATGGSGDDTLTGNDADNVLIGNDGDDSLIGADGNDTLDGGAGADTISAGDGDDTIIYTSGADSIDGGTGSDWLDLRGVSGDANFSLLTGVAIDGTAVDVQNVENLLLSDIGNTAQDDNGDNTIIGGAGDDTISIQGGDDSVDGGGGLDILFLRDQTTGASDPNFTIDLTSGTASGSNGEVNSFQGFETIVAGGGDDLFLSSASDEVMGGGAGADTFKFDFGDGFDTIGDFELGIDLIDFLGLGIAFSDLTITDNSGDALITYDFTTSGQITLTGIAAGDLTDASFVVDVAAPPPPPTLPQVIGTSAGERVDGTAVDEELLGLGGNDTLNGRGGEDVHAGGIGDDRYYLDSAGDTVVEEAGGGYDRVYHALSFTLAEHVEAGNTRGANAMDITGNDLANWITGNDETNVLRGGAGADRLIGKGGLDTLNGGSGNDVLNGGAGADVFAFDAGSGVDVIQDFELGSDVIDVTSLGLAYADLTIVDSNGRAIVIWDDPANAGTLGLIVVENTASSDLLLSSFATAFGSEQPAIVGSEGNDDLVGSQIADELQGLGGNDRLNGAGGADTLIGGTGDDRYDVQDTADLIVELADEGTDRVYTSVDYTLSENIENITATGVDDLALTGNAGINWMTGNAGANVLSGAAGNDRLVGREGADTLEGGLGNDILEGGADADTFAFNSGDGTDVILDFQDGVDLIDFSSLGITFADLLIVDSGANAIVFYDQSDPADLGLVVVNTQSAADLTADDFIFT